MQENHIFPAAGIFADRYLALRTNVPALPPATADPQTTARRLRDLTEATCALAALIDGQLVGYLAWIVVDHFRGTRQRGAYCPEWAHGASVNHEARIYRALYSAAAAQWAAQGCAAHGIGVLANCSAAREAWFWNGFGLTVIDAIRPIDPPAAPVPIGLSVRAASVDDAGALEQLDAEHCAYYSTPPTFMTARASQDAAGFRTFIAVHANSVWIAHAGAEMTGFIRFEANATSASELVRGPDVVAITGAFVRPEFRGRGCATAIVTAGLRHYAAAGYRSCSVDFESFNPLANAFWPQHFTCVCYCLVRHPESLL